MAAEVANADKVLTKAENHLQQFWGRKVSDKILIIENLLNIADNNYYWWRKWHIHFKSQRRYIGNSLVEEDKIGVGIRCFGKSKS